MRNLEDPVEIVSRESSIASITITFNAAGTLPRQLDALRRQSRKLDEIIVVDNASRDGTAELVASRYPDVTLLTMQQNVGVGAGYSAGITYAMKKKCDWVWLLDGDSLPPHDALQLLLGALDQLGQAATATAILAPVCIHGDTGVACLPLAWRGARLIPIRADQDRPLTFVDSVVSSGSLIRREALEAAGLPRSDFFIDFVDHEHCLRMRRQGFAMALVRDCIVDHPQGVPRKVQFLGKTKYWTDHEPWREYYMTRNEIYTMWQYYPNWKTKCFVVYGLLRHAIEILVFGKRKADCLAMMLRGFFDGRRGRLGIRFLPQQQNQAVCDSPAVTPGLLSRRMP